MPRTAAPSAPMPPAVHPERDALLRAVLAAAPGDDTARLVYADWQDEHGQPDHAELIRVECELHRIIRERGDDTPPPPHEAGLWARRTALLRRRLFRYGGQPNAYYPDGFGTAVLWVKKRRGRADGRNPRAWWPGAPLRIPLDRVLRVHLKFNRHADAGLVAAVTAADWLWRVTHVEFDGARLGPGALDPLISSGRLTGLESVWFRGGSVDAGDLARLALADPAPRLTDVLLLDRCRATTGAARRPDPEALAAAVRAVGAAPRARQLRRLSLESSEARDAVARAILDAPGFGQLDSLTLPVRRLTRPVREALDARFGLDIDLL